MVLVLNRGSASLKYSAFAGAQRLVHGSVPHALLAQPANAVAYIFAALADQHLPVPDVVGHRLVHGGPRHFAPCRVSPEVLGQLRAVEPLAPLHLPAELNLIDAVGAFAPQVPQVACFDTAFHHALPDVARLFALPRQFERLGLRRYGFHGLSCEWIVSQIGAKPLGRAVIAHLGGGSSLTAVLAGASIDTTMGLTPTGGLMMGTRVGDLDPGLLLFLLRQGWSADALESLFNERSGVLGISGLSSDMQLLIAARSHNPEAALAVSMYCYQARKAVGSLAASLGGLDTLVFTGGIGEHAPLVRAEICAGLAHLGVRVHKARNAANSAVISSSRSRVMVRVVVADEAQVVAVHTARLPAEPDGG